MPRVAEYVQVTCPCGAEYKVTRQRYDDGRGRYCSNECKYRYRVQPKRGPNPAIKGNSTSWKPGVRQPTAVVFEPGHTPWNKGLTGIHLSPETEFQPGSTVGEGNGRWAGDEVGYDGLHIRLWKARGPAADHECQHADGTCKGPMNWANISHEYRDVDDFMPLCQSHHVRYDNAARMS
jgi:hypothetical protein